MSDMMANHISAALPDEENAFLINACGMLHAEITASSLIKIDVDGNILSKPDFGDLNYGITVTERGM
jgi:ribulose-5-phosphate 4-epimerase/fuculose-1-phosphate aldolase